MVERLSLRKGLTAALATLFLCFLCLPLGAQRSEEEDTHYKKWLEEDVRYIITSQEKAVFQSLATNEEKDQFIEQFWLRRDPDPSTAINEAKEEHYRRIAYANEHFHSGVPGWKTDRGMIYIRFGEPTGIEKYPEGGSYSRKPEEGGGITYVYPFEVWFYTNLEGVGAGIEIEFVDYTRTNDYRIATNSDQKDALLHVPGAGLTLGEELGTVSRLQRITNANLGNPRFDSATRPLRYRDYPLNKLQELYKLQSVPSTEYKDLQKLVAARVQYDQLDVKVRSDVIRISNSYSLVPLTFFIDNSQLTFQPNPQDRNFVKASVGLYGQVQTMTGRIPFTFEESIERALPRSELEGGLRGVSIFQKSLPLEPGRYKLSLVVRDDGSGKVGSDDVLLLVPKAEPDELETSSVMLASQVSEPTLEELGKPFVMGKYRVIPTDGNRFSPQQGFVQAYFEVYNLEVDQTTQKPSPKVEISLRKGDRQLFPFTVVDQEWEYDRDRLLIYKTIPFNGLKKGKYTVEFRVSDLIRNASILQEVDFELTD